MFYYCLFVVLLYLAYGVFLFKSYHYLTLKDMVMGALFVAIVACPPILIFMRIFVYVKDLVTG
jgi:hypothetical protein